jgi:GT2 family glycosyltransferase
MTPHFIDLILLCYGKFATTTKPCLDSLLTDCNNKDFRLTVIDNGSYDGSAEDLKEFLKPYPHVRVLCLKDNIGFAGGMNYGVSLADAEWIFLICNDTIFTPGSLLALFKTLHELPEDIGLVGPVTNAAGNGQEYPIKGSTKEILGQAKLFQQSPCHALTPSYRLDFFCVAIRKSIWDQLHGFDPVYGKGYYEDTDFSMRAKSAGSKMVICEDSFVFHTGSATFSTDPDTRKLIKRNKKIFMHRHPNASLLHKRQCNLAALEEYAKLHQSGLWNNGLAFRAKLRIEALLTDLPRSPIKKWLWQRKIQKILSYFVTHITKKNIF